MKFILVTGAYGGMGKKTVQMLKRQGFGVIALDQKVGAAEEGVFPLQADLTDEASVLRAFEAAKEITEELYAIVGSQEANPMECRISDDSPFGRAMLGHAVGDIVEVEAPVGTLKYKVVSIER